MDSEVETFRLGEKIDKKTVKSIVDAVVVKLSIKKERSDFNFERDLLLPFALQSLFKRFSIAVLSTDELPFLRERASLLSLCNKIKPLPVT